MIGAIAGDMGWPPISGWSGNGGRRRDRRRGRATIVTREHVTIALDPADIAAFDAIALGDESGWEDETEIASNHVAELVARMPRRALAVQARLGAGVVRHLIAVNAMNRL